jgi:hypothetical protein
MKKTIVLSIIGGLVAGAALTIVVLALAWRALPIFRNNSIDTGYYPGIGPGRMMDRFEWQRWDNGPSPRNMGRTFGRQPGIPGRSWMMDRAFSTGWTQPGWMHEMITPLLAEKLGLDTEELVERLESGESLLAVAEAEGLSIADFRTMMEEIHDKAITQAVEDGKITQEQADFMNERGNWMHFGGPRNWLRYDQTPAATATPLP